MGRLAKGFASFGLGAAYGIGAAYDDYKRDLKRADPKAEASFGDFWDKSPVGKLLKKKDDSATPSTPATAPVKSTPSTEAATPVKPTTDQGVSGGSTDKPPTVSDLSKPTGFSQSDSAPGDEVQSEGDVAALPNQDASYADEWNRNNGDTDLASASQPDFNQEGITMAGGDWS